MTDSKDRGSFLDPTALGQYAVHIGWLTIGWSELEAGVDVLLSKLIPLPDDMRHATLGHINLRDRAAMLKSVGYLRRPDEMWFDELEAVLNCIDNEIRPDRNRFIHDIWIEGTSGVSKVNRAPKLRKKIGSGEREYRPYERKPVEVMEIKQVTRKIERANIALQELAETWPTPGASPRKCAPLFLPQNAAAAPSPEGQKPSAPSPPPLASEK